MDACNELCGICRRTDKIRLACLSCKMFSCTECNDVEIEENTIEEMKRGIEYGLIWLCKPCKHIMIGCSSEKVIIPLKYIKERDDIIDEITYKNEQLQKEINRLNDESVQGKNNTNSDNDFAAAFSSEVIPDNVPEPVAEVVIPIVIAEDVIPVSSDDGSRGVLS